MRDLFISGRRRRRLRIIAALAGGLVAVGLAAFLLLRDGGDVRRGEEVEFRATKPSKPVEEKGLDWRYYHRNLAHTGYMPVRVSPPYRRKWLFGGKVLMEFPP